MGRRRRLMALAGIALMVVVLGLDAHAALPEHHHTDGHETVCVASMAVATLTAFGCCVKAPPLQKASRRPRIRIRSKGRVVAPVIPILSRAGPCRSVVLRS